MTHKEDPAEKQLAQVAYRFASKWPWQIDFADADMEEYRIFLAYQEWKKQHADPDDNKFAKTFPYMDKLWDILCNWNIEDTKTIAERKEIIDLAKKHLGQTKSTI